MEKIQNLVRKGNAALAVMAATASSSLIAFAAEASDAGTAQVETALNTVFSTMKSIAGAVQKGISTIVLPIGIAVCLYFLVRMLLASDAKDVQAYRKRCITVAIIVAVAVAIPGLLNVMSTLGGTLNTQLTPAG